MKLKYKNILLCSVLGLSGLGVTSCNDFLDREPITEVTPQSYFSTVDQVGSYLNRYYNDALRNSRGQFLFHNGAWNSGLSRNDEQTDNVVRGGGSRGYFAGQWEVAEDQGGIKGNYGKVRVWNWFLQEILAKKDAGSIAGDKELLNQYLGEGYFFRAMTYYNILGQYGDAPIIEEVLPNDEAVLKENAVRAPRNEVARFILSDLDKAIALLKNKGFAHNQRINKQVAQLFKSRVALFEGTFEKYHKGSGRVPGDANWPGKAFHPDFSADIDAEITFFLKEAMSASKEVAEDAQLTTNSHKINPAMGEVYGWNPYFEMYAQPNLNDVPEVLLWRQYNTEFNISTSVPNRIQRGDNNGFMTSYINSFLMKNGLPIYAQNSNYQGDVTLDKQFEGRDERLQLFVWSDNDVFSSDLANAAVKDTLSKDPNAVIHFDHPHLLDSNMEVRMITGYAQRKYLTYDYTQRTGDEPIGWCACPVFRSVEALLNYMEACYELNGNLDASAKKYWKQIRERAGVNPDFQKTIDNTDLDKEADIQNGKYFGDVAVYSNSKKVNETLYNIRRERRNEFIGEGMRWDDIKRWRSWDMFIGGQLKFMPQGMNLWAEAYKTIEGPGEELKADGSTDANVSSKEVSTYVRPLQRTKVNNDLYEGYTWMKAYYLSPISVKELSLSPNFYQNLYWPNYVGKALE